MSENVRLSAKQEKAIVLLLSNHTIAEVAKRLGVNERTIYRWSAMPHFQERQEQERAKLREEAFGGLKLSLNKAVKRLDKLLDDKSSAICLKACQTVIHYNLEVLGQEEIEKRLEILEGKSK